MKSTDSSRHSAPVKLSNWRRLVTSPLPSFFLALEFDDEPNPQRAYLIHVWEALVARVLKRLRELSRDDPGADLRARRMILKWSEEDRLAAPSSIHFIKRVVESVGDDPHAYAARKHDLIAGLGYAEHTGRIETTVRAPEGWTGSWNELFADLGLGLVDQLETQGGALWDTRFGIETAAPQQLFDTVGLLKPGESRPASRDVLELRLGPKRLKLDVDVFVASLVGPDPASLEDLKLRLRIPHGDIVTSPRDPSGTLRWSWPDPEQAVPLRDLVPVSSLLALVAEADAPVETRLAGKPFGTIQIPRSSVPETSLLVADCVMKAWTVAKAVDAQDRVRVGLHGLVMQQRLLSLCSRVLTTTPENAMITVPLSAGESISEGRYGYPHLLAVWFENEMVVLPTLHVGEGREEPDGDERHFEVAVDRCLVAPPRLIDVGEEVDEKSLLEEAASLDRDCEIITWWVEPDSSGT